MTAPTGLAKPEVSVPHEENPLTNTDASLIRVLSIGAGAIGTYIGGNLALTGNQVVFLEQPQIAEELRQRGLSLEQDGQVHSINAPLVTSSLDDAIRYAPFDLALFALKSFDTQPFVQTMITQQDKLPPILCLQNGVDNELVLAEAFGPDHVIAGTVTSAIGRRAAGQIVLERKRGMGIAGTHPISQQLAQALNGAGLNCRMFAHPADMKWSKMLTNLLANASSAILNMTPGEIFSHPGLFKMEVLQLREALRVMDARKIQVVDLPGTPVVALAFAIRNLPLSIARPLLTQSMGAGRGKKMPSFHVDLYAGRGKSEVEFLNGAVVRYGKEASIPTPVNQLLTETLISLSRGEIPLDTYAGQPEKFLGELEKLL
jgi:2-dehydropantoate 2-reductase